MIPWHSNIDRIVFQVRIDHQRAGADFAIFSNIAVTEYCCARMKTYIFSHLRKFVLITADIAFLVGYKKIRVFSSPEHGSKGVIDQEDLRQFNFIEQIDPVKTFIQ